MANPESKPLKEYIDILLNVYGPETKADFVIDDGMEMPGLDVDMTKTIEAIGFKPVVSFKDGITKMIEARKAKIHLGRYSV